MLNHKSSGRHSFRIDSTHAFLYLLTRYHSPSQRQSDDSAIWQYDYTSLSQIFNGVLTWMDDTHSHRLRQLNRLVEKLPGFNEAICNKIRMACPGLDAVGGMPPDAINCALFGDGSRFKVF